MFESLQQNLYGEGDLGDSRAKEIINEAKDRVSKHFGIPEYRLKLDYSFADLPRIYEVGIERVGNYGHYIASYIKKVGEVLGTFNPFNKKIEFNRALKFYPYQLLRTAVHELVHQVQGLKGELDRKSRYQLEEEAHRVTQQLT